MLTGAVAAWMRSAVAAHRAARRMRHRGRSTASSVCSIDAGPAAPASTGTVVLARPPRTEDGCQARRSGRVGRRRWPGYAARGVDPWRNVLVGSRPLSIPLHKKVSSYTLNP